MLHENSISLLVISPKGDSRLSAEEGMLRTFLRNSNIFNIISWLHLDLAQNDVQKQIETVRPEAQTLISADLPAQIVGLIKEFVKKTTPTRLAPKLIMFSYKSEIERCNVIRTLMGGMQGILLAPFTLEKLLELLSEDDQRITDNKSRNRLKLAVDMLIQEGISASETPSMVRSIPEGLREKFNLIAKKTLSENLVNKLYSMNHQKRIESYSHLIESIKHYAGSHLQKMK